MGISRLESEADYNGPLGEVFIAPIVDGILFNWDTNASIAGITSGLDWKTPVGEASELEVWGRYTHSYLSSYSESSDFPSFSEDTGTVSVSADFTHPWHTALGNTPLFGTAHLGVTAFTGQSRDALGFTHLYLAGYSVDFDISESNRFFNSFSVGAHVNLGNEVDGYSLRFAWDLKYS